MAEALRSCCRRPADLAARYGGEEFALIMPETSLAGAMVIAEAARTAGLARGVYDVSPFVAISIGVAVASSEAGLSPMSLIAAADLALFEAKGWGRNRVVGRARERPRADANLSPIAACNAGQASS